MVDSLNFNAIEKQHPVYFGNIQAVEKVELDNQDASIFENDAVLALEEQLDSVQDEQGFFMNAWDDFKGFVGVGVSSEKCENAIEKFKNGEITYEEALKEIEKFDSKQDGSLELFSNIATGVAAIAVASAAAAAIVASGGTATPLVLAAIGAGTGAVTKVGVKMTDRATNDLDGDALNGKQIAKDALSGAVTGGIGAATMGTGSSASTLAESVAKSAARSAKTGVVTGSITGASNYTLDCAFEDDKQFKFGELVTNTATGAVVGATVGGIMGSANGAMRYNGIVKHGGVVKAVTDEAGEKVVDETGKVVVANASKEAVAANALCNAEYKLVNKAVRDLGSSLVA